MENKVYIVCVGGNNNNQAKVASSLLNAGFVTAEVVELEETLPDNLTFELTAREPIKAPDRFFPGTKKYKPHHAKKRKGWE